LVKKSGSGVIKEKNDELQRQINELKAMIVSGNQK